MSVKKFLEQYQSQIQNIDGTFDDEAVVTILENGLLEFIWFKQGKCVHRQKK
jgi:hypothetical protein